jgi:SpoVK/Ycf46/Vps4 family AAA+-type ATPase
MADLTRLTKLFEAIATRDWDGAKAIAREVAAGEERIGHHGAAQRLRGALHANGYHPKPLPDLVGGESSEPQGATYFLSNALLPVQSRRSLSELRLTSATRAVIEEIITEWLRRDELFARHIDRRTKVLFYGPPGCGKSVTARAIGAELGLPVYIVRFDAIVGAYLGQTALHLRQLFRFAETTPCIVLVDEIDALGKRRGNPLDVGELDRVVIALLQELEHSRPAGLLIATSNLPRHLDEALWRRFDVVAEFPAPTKKQLRSFASERVLARGVKVSRLLTTVLARAKNYADIERSIDAEERRQVLNNR